MASAAPGMSQQQVDEVLDRLERTSAVFEVSLFSPGVRDAHITYHVLDELRDQIYDADGMRATASGKMDAPYSHWRAGQRIPVRRS